jgi:hypothetical protein
MQTVDEISGPTKRKRGASNPWWILVLYATAVILFAIGAWYGYTSWRFVSQGEQVPATVVTLQEVSGSDGTGYSPVFEYEVGGRTYSYESVNSSNPPTHKVGQQTTLWVMPDDPEQARENSFFELWLLPVIMGVVSGVVAVIAIVASVAVWLWRR